MSNKAYEHYQEVTTKCSYCGGPIEKGQKYCVQCEEWMDTSSGDPGTDSAVNSARGLDAIETHRMITE